MGVPVAGGIVPLGNQGTACSGRGSGAAGLLRTQLFWSLRTGARGRSEAAGPAAAARRATEGSASGEVVNVAV